MSVDSTMLLFESYLQKRKDTMKLRWSTYWFRLQNSTLFFYTQKNGSALHLRGNYYIYAVQSVREVSQTNGSKRFMFEIIMSNGKRKMLAAETAALRQKWIKHLWHAMQLSASLVSEPRRTDCEKLEQDKTKTTSTPSPASHTASAVESPPPSQPPAAPSQPPAAPSQAPAAPTESHQDTGSTAPPTQPVCEEPIPPNILPAPSYPLHCEDTPDHCDVTSAAEGQEGDYDILPIRKNGCEIQPATETEDIYDIPVSCRRVIEEQDTEESIYDVPSSLLRRMPDQTPIFSCEETPEDEPYWRI